MTSPAGGLVIGSGPQRCFAHMRNREERVAEFVSGDEQISATTSPGISARVSRKILARIYAWR